MRIRERTRERLLLLRLILLREKNNFYLSSRRERGETFYFYSTNEKGARVFCDSFKECMYVINIRMIEERPASVRKSMKERREECKHAIGARRLLPTDHAIGGWRWRGESYEREAIKATDKQEERSFIENTRLREHAEREMLIRSSICNETQKGKNIYVMRYARYS